jgi:TonB-dependent SusC/RagA subfamily outer membrane receptor
VVDGLPLDNASTGGGDPLNFINPEDIESFDVLKDASATAIYGARGANGVVLKLPKEEKQEFPNLHSLQILVFLILPEHCRFLQLKSFPHRLIVSVAS